MGFKKIILVHISKNVFMIRQRIITINIFIIVLFFISNHSNSQEELTFEYVEAKSYDLYKNQKWNELIRLGKLAIEDRIDFYSLRVRLGTAYYKTINYFPAISNFEKALEIGYDDELIYEFLYYSYMFTGRIEDKNFVFSKLSNSKKTYLRPLNNSFIDNIFAEAGTGISNDGTQYEWQEILNPNYSYAELLEFGDYSYFNGGIMQTPFDRLNVTYSYSHYNLKKRFETHSRYGLSNYGSFDNYTQKQNRFFNSLGILVGNGFVISPAGHYINIKENKISDTVHTDPSTITYLREETSIDNFILSLAISKYISTFNLKIYGSFSYLNENHQSQYGMEFKSHPFGSANFFTKTNATLHYQNKISNLVFTQLLGLRTIKNLQLEAYASFGKINNFNEQNGYLVFNDPDLIKYKFGAMVNYNFSNNLSADFIFDYQFRERVFPVYSAYKNTMNSPVFQSGSKKFDYNVIRLSVGIKFYF